MKRFTVAMLAAIVLAACTVAPISEAQQAPDLESFRAESGSGPTPNQSYLVKQMQGTMAACLGGLYFELSKGARTPSSPWDHVDQIIHTPDDWRLTDQKFEYRGTIPGQSSTGAYVKFSNARWDPEHSDINYGDKKIAQNVEVTNPDKTIVVRNDSNATIDVSYEETESLTNSYSSSVTHGMTMDVSVDSTQTISGEYAGISAEVSMQEHFGVSKTDEETREQSQEGTHEETLSIEFEAAPHNYYLVTLTKKHSVTYQPFSISGVMDFDFEMGFGQGGGGVRQADRKPSGTVHVQGVAGFEQFVHGYDTNYPSMAGFYDEAYTRTKNGIGCVTDLDRRTLSISGVNQASLEADADYQVESLGDTLPPKWADLPVKDADDLHDGR